METHQRTWTVWLVLFCGVSTTVTASTATCQQTCPPSSSVFNYQNGHKYIYRFEGTSVTTLPGAQSDVSKVQLKATVELGVQSECSHLIRVKDVQLIGAESKKYTNLHSLEQYAAVANFQSGVVNSQLCTDEHDNKASLNLKRAVLSLLQISAASGISSAFAREVDVFGDCPTDISSSSDGDTTIVKKNKHLNKCAHREDLKQDVLSTPFIGHADFKNTPLLDSTYTSEHKVKKGVVNTAVSHETYFFRPFSKLGSGAKTTIETKITLVSQKSADVQTPASVNVPRSIIFEAPHQPESSTSNKQALLEALVALGEATRESVETDSARKFKYLVDILRASSKEDILSVYGEVKAGAGFADKRAARKALLDGIFKAGTGDSVIAAVELLKSHEIEGELSRLWYVAIGYARHASASSLAAVTTLLDDTTNLPREAVLAVGSLAGRYCREHNCENVAQLNDLISKLARLVKTNVKTIQEENNVITALKALGNIHHLNDAVAEKLKQVASDKSVPARVRVAALETYQTDACRNTLKKSALDILSDTLEDSEIRIKAYLALVECPSGAVANSLKELLEKEPTHQVGSFIVSHLRNLRASTNPSKESAKQHFRSLKPRKHFPEDLRKFSRNFELSYILDGLNIGNSIESNIIYSTNSYVPRSVSLNLTTELFGHSYNVLELSTRSENVDRIIESYFGPKGCFKSHDWLELITSAKDTIDKYSDKLREKFEETLRHKRSISQNDLERIENEVIKSLPPSHKSNELILDLSLKLFGSELAWINVDQSTHQLSAEGIIDKIFDLLNGAIDKAKHFDYEVRKHFTFLDTELTYPTGLGLPLKLEASGSTAVHLLLSGQVDIPALLKDPGNSVLKLDFRPSAAIEIFGTLTLASPVEDSGLKVAYTLHTDTGLQIEAKGLQNAGLDLKIGLPVQKQDILTVKTEILSVIHEHGHGEVAVPLIFNLNRKDYKGCFDQASPIIGLTFCTDIGFPYDLQGRSSALYPLNGPSILSLRLESEDVSSYHFKVLSTTDKSSKHWSLEAVFETPNSRADRRLALLIEANKEPQREIKASFKSPWKELVFQIVNVDSNREQSLTGKFLNDGAEYSLKIGAKVTGESNHQTYTPLLEYKSPDQKERQVAKGRKTSARVTQSYHVKGSVTVDKQGSSQTLTFNKVSVNTPQGDVEIDGSVRREENAFQTDLKVSYGKQHIILKSKLQKVGEHHYKVGALVSPSNQKDLSVSFNWEVEYTNNELRNEIIIIHGSDLKSETNRITINQQLHYGNSLKDLDISTKNSLTYPLLNVNARFDGNAKPKNINYDLLLSYDTYTISSELHAKRDIKKPGDYDLTFEAKVLDSVLIFKSNRDIAGPDRSKFVHVLELVPIVKYELSTDVTHKYHRNDVNLQLLAVLKIDDKPDPYKLDSGLIVKPELVNTHAKFNVGSETYVDSIILINRQDGKPSGNIKVFVKDYVDATSTYNFNRGGGRATLTIDVPKINRKIQGNADLTITGTVHAGKVELLWNADHDPSRKLIIQTTSDIKPDSIDSKNVIQIVDYKTVLNIKGALTGKVNDGHLIANGDLILPNGRQFTVKWDETLHVRPTNSEGRVEIILIDIPRRGSQPRRLSLEAAAKDVNTKDASFEGSGKLEYKNTDGKDIKLTVHAKNIPQGQQNVLGGEAHLEGSYLTHPIKLKVDAEVSKAVVTYKGSGGYGNDVSVNVAGTVRTGLGGTSPKQLENTLEFKLPSDPLKQVKLFTSVSLSTTPDDQLELKTSNVLTWNDANTLKLDGELSGDTELAAGKVTVVLPKEKARSLAFRWIDPKDNENVIKKGASLKLNWDDDKEVLIAGEIEVPNDRRSYKIKILATTPNDKLKRFDLDLAAKESNSPVRHVETDAILLLNDDKYTLDSKIGLAPGIPLFDITVVGPDGTSKLFLNFDKFTEDEIKLQSEIRWTEFGGGYLITDGELKLSVEDFKLLWNIDSPKLNIDKWHVEAGHRAVKGTKKIFFNAKAAGEGILSGSTTLRTKTDENTVTYEGSGVVEINGQNQRFNFHFERTKLLQDANGETGLLYKGTVKVGPKDVDALFKLTNKEFHLLNNICLKADDCAKIDAKYKLNTADLSKLDQEAILAIDFKNVGFPYAVDLKVKTIRQDWDVEHGVELHIFTKRNEFKYSQKLTTGEKGGSLTITLPHRVIVLDVNTNADWEGKKGRVKVGFTLWWDKVRKPASHSDGSLIFTHDVDEDKGFLFTGEARFNNPSLERELVIRGKTAYQLKDLTFDSSLDLDVFKKENQKITVLLVAKIVDYSPGLRFVTQLDIKSKGQNIDIVVKEVETIKFSDVGYIYDLQANYKIGKHPRKESQIKFASTGGDLQILVVRSGEELLNVEEKLTIDNRYPVIDAQISVIGYDTVVLHSSVKDKTLLSVHRKNTPNNKVLVTADTDNKLAIEAQRFTGGAKKSLFHFAISFKDDDFLKTDFGWSTETVRKLIDDVRQEADKFLQKLKKILSDNVTECNNELLNLLETLKKNQPNFKRFLEVAEQQLKLIQDEITKDPVLQEISGAIKNTLGSISVILEETIKGVSGTLDAVYTAILEIETTLIEAVKRASPSITEAWKNVVESVVGITQIILNELSNFINELSKFVQAHEEDLKQYLSIFTGLSQDTGKLIKEFVVKVTSEIKEFVKIVATEVEALPIYSLTQEKYNEVLVILQSFKIPDSIWAVIQEVLSNVKEVLPTDELRELFSEIEEYINKLIKKEPVEDKKELQIIFEKLLKAIKSFITLLKDYVKEPESSELGILEQRIPFSIKSLLQLPRLLAIRFSPLTYLTSEELPDFTELYYTYKPTLNPLDWIPPFRAYGILINSNTFFTFDHRHYKLKGTCSYVLAQDYYDGNFSIVANLEGGQLKSIGITDGTDSLELLADKSIKVNGAVKEYPVHEGQFSAWRQVGSANIRAKSGVRIHCETDIDLCFIEVSGFYFARTRGLLGTIDYEPWDDFTIPNGHVAQQASEFVNAWKLSPGCSNAPAESSVSDSPVSECSEIFSGSSELRNCFPFIKPTVFREACNDATRGISNAEEKKKVACIFAATYVKACRRDIPVINTPSSCVHCSAIGGNAFGIGEFVSLKVPQRSADIIVLVQQTLDNAEIFRELVTPLVPTLTNDLKAKGINDVKFILIGYGAPGQKYADYLTTGGQFGFGSQGIVFPEYERELNITVDSTETFLKYVKQAYDHEVRRLQGFEAFIEATKYPFRVGAVKTIVSVIASPCEKTTLLSPLYLNFATKLYNELGISIHLITPVEDVKADGSEEKQIRQLVGFDDESTFSLSDARKKTLDGDTELRKALDYSQTICTEGTQKTHGAVFNSNNFLHAKQSARKQFLQVVSHRIADSLTAAELTEDCTCLIWEGVYPRPVCRVKSRREKERTKTKGVKG